MDLLLIAISAVWISMFVWMGIAVEIWAPKNVYRHVSAVSFWLLAAAFPAAVLERQFIYLVMFLLFAAPSFTALSLVKENSKLKEFDRTSQHC